MWRNQQIIVDNRILFALGLHAEPQKIQKYYFLSTGPREYLEWSDATRLDIEAPKVPFSTKITKMPLINLGLTEGQTKSKSS